MAAQLNIKDAETIELARTIARRRGKSVTAIIRDALEQADRADQSEVALRVKNFLAGLRRIPGELPPELAGKTSREIIQEFHEQEWQEQYGRDKWS